MHKKVMFILLIVCMLTALMPAIFAAQTSEALTDTGAIDTQILCNMSAEEVEVLQNINAARFDAGKEPITAFDKLQTVGDIRASELTVQYTNDRPNGGGYYTALTDAGISSYKAVSEIYVKGYSSGTAFMAAVMNASGPAATTVNEKYFHAAIGYTSSDSTNYWELMYYVSHSCAHSGFELILPSELCFTTGTTIEKMCIMAKTTCANCGTSYLPVISEYCTGFDATSEGIQTVTVSCLGVTETFTVTMMHEEIDYDMSAEELEELRIINRERHAEGLNPVTVFPKLQVVANIRANEIVTLMSHDRPNGTSCFTTLGEVGLSYYLVGENIAAGHKTPAAVMVGFMNSEGHRANILTEKFMHVGLDYVYNQNSTYWYHWSQMFYTNHGCSYTSMILDLPDDMSFYPDCSIDDMGIMVRFNCVSCGTCYMPLTEEFCSGYEPSKIGEQTITVSLFGLEKSFKINTIDHEHTFEGTDYVFCTQEGYTEYVCTVCNYAYHDNYVDAVGHNYYWYVAKEPTLTSTGSANAICLRCHENQIRTLPMLNDQDYIYEVVTPATCLAEGTVSYTYTVDTRSFTFRAAIPIAAHAYEEEHRAPTCTSAGIITYTCATCGSSYVSEGAAALGHSYDAVLIAPTCEAGGYTTYTCTACNDSYIADETAALGHSYAYTDNGENHTVTCANCDYTTTKDHVYIAGACICGAIEVTEPRYEPKESLKFTMSISVGAEMTVTYNIMGADVNSYSDFYLEVKKDVAGGEPVTTIYGITEDREQMTAKVNPATGEALMYQVTYKGFNAKEMGDNFSTTLYAVGEDGTIYYGTTVVDSIKSYLLGKIDAEASIPELKTMAVEMLKYGAAAQVRLGYNTDNLVTADLTKEQLSYATTEIPDAVNNASSTGTGAAVNTNITVTSRVQLNLSCIYTTATDPNAVKCVITDSEGKILAEIAATNKGNIMFSAIYENVGAKEMRDVINATFYEGETAISKTISWSVESYVAQVRAKTNVAADELNMVNAMLTYGDSVAAYMEAK